MPAGRVRLALAALMALVATAPSAAGESTPAVRQALTIGVVPQRAFDDDEAELMGEAGVSSVRVWFSWAQVEPSRGERDWWLLDDTVTANARAGMATLPFLFGTPAWAAAEDGRDCTGDDCVSYPPVSDETRADFAGFATAAARRYGPGGAFWSSHRALPYRPIEVWQIWNEPNLSSFYHPAVDPIGYATLVEAGAAAIRSQDPDATVLLAGLTGTKTNAKRWSTTAFLTQLYAVPRIAASFDGIAVHPYNRSAGGTIDQIEAARAVATANGDKAGIWVTEVGWASAGKRRWGLVKSPDGQARSLRKAYTRLIEDAPRLGVRAVYWYAWRDTEPGHAVCGWCPWSGLLDRIGRRKPAYFELKALTDGE
jgi:hypothetical protein